MSNVEQVNPPGTTAAEIVAFNDEVAEAAQAISQSLEGVHMATVSRALFIMMVYTLEHAPESVLPVMIGEYQYLIEKARERLDGGPQLT